MTRVAVTLAAANGFVAVALGALASHSLDNVLSARGQEVFDIALRYHAIHALALVAAAWALDRFSYSRLPLVAVYAFQAGIVLFCGSLYALAFATGSDSGWVSILGPLAPLGGLGFLVGWAALATAPWK